MPDGKLFGRRKSIRRAVRLILGRSRFCVIYDDAVRESRSDRTRVAAGRTAGRAILTLLTAVVFAALHFVQGGLSQDRSVRPSVCLSVKRANCDKTK